MNFPRDPKLIPMEPYFVIRAWNSSTKKWVYWHKPSGMLVDRDMATLFDYREKPSKEFIAKVAQDFPQPFLSDFQAVTARQSISIEV